MHNIIIFLINWYSDTVKILVAHEKLIIMHNILMHFAFQILERCIKTLFTNPDISQVKQYVQRQCQKLMEGKVSLQDCIFAKEYRGMAGYRPGACVPALEIAR